MGTKAMERIHYAANVGLDESDMVVCTCRGCTCMTPNDCEGVRCECCSNEYDFPAEPVTVEAWRCPSCDTIQETRDEARLCCDDGAQERTQAEKNVAVLRKVRSLRVRVGRVDGREVAFALCPDRSCRQRIEVRLPPSTDFFRQKKRMSRETRVAKAKSLVKAKFNQHASARFHGG